MYQSGTTDGFAHMMIQPLIIRADASTRVGTGHVMRCLSLAQGWQRTGGEVQFVCAEITPSLEARLNSEGFTVLRLSATPGSLEDAKQTLQICMKLETGNLKLETQQSETQLSGFSHQPSWVVCDGYQFDAAYQRAIKDAGLRLLLFDDYGHATHYYADLVLNQNLSARAEWYADRAPYTRLLLGTKYVLFRQQFLAYRDWQREIPAVARKVLVTLGGADPDNVTGKVIEALRSLDVEAKIVIGGSNPHLAELRSQVPVLTPPFFPVSGFSPQISLVVDTPEMPSLMAWADVAIAAGGTTSWELAFMGLPNLVLVLAENQRGVAAALAQAGVARQTAPNRLADDLSALLPDVTGRRQMSERARQLVDGDGANRVVSCLRAAGLRLRRAAAEDCELIWKWANDSEARAVSLSSDPIPWETHQKWFAAHSTAPSCLFYVATNGNDNLVGQIRYDLSEDEAIVSVSLAKESRGRGYGASLIVRGSEQCFAESKVNRIRAYIKPTNTASVRAFDRAGYRDDGQAEVRGQMVRQFIFDR
jgi:UDP-2,4-diacetamido-2,4,6-trideoxy-beta-L-altropyranose hydrolase